ncbi:hypothetical protein BOTBODRAFT_30928 [Botryobasidium botryosum FD-172 SS1]|uniref:Ketoreductase (KR) domain-containing protein n=1 Tax=Botryobasidium botryosum (strain FD-172 SS1) TaxID=930990 RepID=A0A067MNA4_BOTB1|nr:hypothetical protein BOTBODRAFT_30928 [Botryobasidium botryosum FD-172 SS1]
MDKVQLSDPPDSPRFSNHVTRYDQASASSLYELLRVHLWRLVITAHALIVRFLQSVSSRVFHLVGILVGLKPYPVRDPQQSALLVLDAGEGVGKSLALKLAECGYTVFACLPHNPGTGDSSRASSLLYAWQSKKERARDTPHALLGSIIPLVIDPAVADERTKSVETIRAYCATHSLSFSALLWPPYSRSDRLGADSADERVLWDYDHYFPLSLANTDLLAWMVEKHLTYPLKMIQQYLGILHKSNGRVVFLSSPSRTSLGSIVFGHESPHKAAREAMARTLSAELRPLGISVSLVTIGHLGRCVADLTTISQTILSNKVANEDFLSGEAVFPIFATQLNIARRLARLSTEWLPTDSTTFECILHALQSQHPRPTYRVGVDYLVKQALWWIPGAVWTLAQRFYWEQLWYADRAQSVAPRTRKATVH